MAKKQVKVLEDLAGLKIRAATPMLTNMVKTLGAVPVSIQQDLATVHRRAERG